MSLLPSYFGNTSRSSVEVDAERIVAMTVVLGRESRMETSARPSPRIRRVSEIFGCFSLRIGVSEEGLKGTSICSCEEVGGV